MDIDKPPSPLVLLLVGLGAFLLLCMGCSCAAVFGPFLAWMPK
jgi:hypothetical protein